MGGNWSSAPWAPGRSARRVGFRGSRRRKGVPVSLAERTGQLDTLHRLFDRCRAGQGRIALVKGPVGHGKTALLHTFTRKADQDGALCLQADCSEFENDFPFGVMNQLFQDLDPRKAPLPNVFQELLSTLLALTEKRPVVLGIDDVQFADVVSLRCLLYLARRTRSARILLVLTEAERSRPAHPALFAELAEFADTLCLPPLSTTESPELTGGNPAIVKAVRADHGVPGGHYRETVVACLHRGGNDVVTVARALAVLGPEATETRMSAMTGGGTVRRTLDLMTRAGLLRGGSFRHPAARLAVLEDLAPDERARAHRRAATLLREQGESALPVAKHLVRAGGPIPPWAPDVLAEAAELALCDDDVTAAVDFLTLAQQAEPGRVAIVAKLARAEWQLNPSAVLRHFEPLLAGIRAGLLSRSDALCLVRQLLWHGRTAQAAEVLDRIRGSDELDEAELWMTAGYPKLGRVRHDHAVAAVVRRPLGTGPPPRTTTALTEVLTRGNRGDAVAKADRFLRETRLSHATPWSDEPALSALLTFVCADEIDTAEAECERLQAEAADRGGPTWQAGFSAVRAEIALRRGDFPTAAAQAGAALTHLSAKAWGVAVGYPLGSLILASTKSGEFGKAAAYLARPVPDVLSQTRHGVHYLYARAHHHLDGERHHAALADFLSCGKLLRDWGIDTPGFVPWRSGAAESWLALGNPDEAKRLLFEQMSRPGVDGTRARALALRVLAMTGKESKRPQLLSEAVDILENCGDRYELARVLTDLSRVRHHLGEHKRARMTLRRAWHLARSCAAAPLCQELMPEPGTVEPGAGRRADATKIGSLSDSERRVAGLAVAGYTNREIARKLFITDSTVEQHLTRVYRKLDVKYRRELPTDLHTDMATSA
ncbi:helix-turn-helix transcriptional regulator [Amycolatopsis speibonae]|uniref:AAA family ATPase n=1 Tax=Amycolatopsis speibonae TaxID=1450224 RepID=A0ABV7PCH9_9PSEU